MPSQYDDPKDGKERYQKASERIMSRIAALERPSFPVI
jgi:1-acyl-sn-glycerol-3-phosphate acyltransferase